VPLNQVSLKQEPLEQERCHKIIYFFITNVNQTKCLAALKTVLVEQVSLEQVSLEQGPAL
jgi:hypothetical protein